MILRGIMLYCLINDSSLIDNNMKINYSLINDSEEFKIDKTFNIDIVNDNVIYVNFSQFQLRKNSIKNYIDEISKDFSRSKYILGETDFENYFFEIGEFEEMNNNFKDKYLKLNDALKKLNNLKSTL